MEAIPFSLQGLWISSGVTYSCLRLVRVVISPAVFTVKLHVPSKAKVEVGKKTVGVITEVLKLKTIWVVFLTHIMMQNIS